MRIGFLVNPIAGMGGPVGLKGTDGRAKNEATKRGASMTSPLRASRAIASTKHKALSIEWFTCAGQMGEDELKDAGITGHIAYEPRQPTSKRDTVAAVKTFLEDGVALVLFAGGDGTARDIIGVVDARTPILGIPTGVKMQSGVFLNRPEDLGDVLMTFAVSGVTKEAEVMDINEDSFRQGVIEAKLYGIALVPDDSSHLQLTKMSYHSGTADDESAEIGQYIADSMERDVLYIIGPGTTTSAIAEAMGLRKTLLGTDAYLNREMVVRDGGEKELLEELRKAHHARIVVSPIGAQGFVFGRGNQQISAKIIRRVGKDNIVVVAGPTKLKSTGLLKVDTGDKELDELLRGKTRVVTGYKRKKLVDVA